MRILLIEAFFGGSHKQWAQGLKSNSGHDIDILSLSDKHWKWRMHGGAITLSNEFNQLNNDYDLILATDMLDLNSFISHARKKLGTTPCAIYFHENQLTYPWSKDGEDKKLGRDLHYAFINFNSALVADKVYFNSNYHKESFLAALPKFLKMYPDYNLPKAVEKIRNKSEVIHLGMDLQYFEHHKPEDKDWSRDAILLWNHRWEYDKNPEAFFAALYELQDRGVRFKLIVLGARTNTYPEIFDEAKERLNDNILHWGFAESKEEYASLLWQADILPVTSNQDFFGGSVVEAMACNVYPLLPQRLAYSEHLPEKFSATFQYQNEEDFVNRLQRLIFDVRVIRKQNIRQWVMKYDWQNMQPVYDTSFDALKK